MPPRWATRRLLAAVAVVAAAARSAPTAAAGANALGAKQLPPQLTGGGPASITRHELDGSDVHVEFIADDGASSLVRAEAKEAAPDPLAHGAEVYGDTWDGKAHGTIVGEPQVVYTHLPPRPDATGGWLFLVLVLFGTSLYAVSVLPSGHKVKAYTSAMVEGVLAILLASVFFALLKGITEVRMRYSDARVERSAPDGGLTLLQASELARAPEGPSDAEVALAFGRMLLVLVAVEGWLWKDMDEVRREAVRSFGGNLFGLMAADSFGVMQETPPWSGSFTMSGALSLLSVAYMYVLCFAAVFDFRRALLQPASEAGTEVKERYLAHRDMCISVERRATAMCAGLTIVQALRFYVLGKLPPMHGEQEASHRSCPRQLLFCGAVLLVVGALLKDPPPSKQEEEIAAEGAAGGSQYSAAWELVAKQGVRRMEIGRAVAHFAAAWATAYAIRWEIFVCAAGGGVIGSGNILADEVLVAAVASWCAVGLAAALNVRVGCAAPDSTGALFFVPAALWDSAFTAATYQMAEEGASGEMDKRMKQLRFGALIFSVGFLLWRVFLLPQVVAAQRALDDAAADAAAAGGAEAVSVTSESDATAAGAGEVEPPAATGRLVSAGQGG